MFSQHTGVLARVLGAAINVTVTCGAGCLVAVILGYVPSTPWWFFMLAFALIGLTVWSVTSFGDWLWSIEEGGYGLQRALKVIQATAIAGGLFCALFFKVLFFFKGF